MKKFELWDPALQNNVIDGHETKRGFVEIDFSIDVAFYLFANCLWYVSFGKSKCQPNLKSQFVEQFWIRGCFQNPCLERHVLPKLVPTKERWATWGRPDVARRFVQPPRCTLHPFESSSNFEIFFLRLAAWYWFLNWYSHLKNGNFSKPTTR